MTSFTIIRTLAELFPKSIITVEMIFSLYSQTHSGSISAFLGWGEGKIDT